MLSSHYQCPRRNSRLLLPHHMAACQRQESSAICQLWHVGQQIWAEHFIITSKCRPTFEYSVVESEWGFKVITKFPPNFMHKLCKGAIREYLILKDNCPKTCPNSLISHFPARLARTLLCWSSLPSVVSQTIVLYTWSPSIKDCHNSDLTTLQVGRKKKWEKTRGQGVRGDKAKQLPIPFKIKCLDIAH